MKEADVTSSLYRLLGSEMSSLELLQKAVSILQDEFPNTLWNMGAVVESTARLKFVKEDILFRDLNLKAGEVFEKGETVFSREDVPSGYKWAVYIPMSYDRQKSGVVICAGRGRKQRDLDVLGQELGFVFHHHRLNRKLVKDSILMNTILTSSQTTASSTEIAPMVKVLLPQLKKYLAADQIRLYMWRNKNCVYFNEEAEKTDFLFPNESSIVKEVLLSSRPVMAKEAYTQENFNPEVDAIGGDVKTLNLIAAPLLVSGQVVGVLVTVNNDPDRLFVGSELVWVRNVCSEIGATLERLNLYQNMHHLFLSSIESLAGAIEGKDPYTHGHSRRVTMFAVLIGREMDLDDKTVENIRLSALLHDIGKIAIPESILLKTSSLTDDEWKILKEHPLKGIKMLEPVREFAPLFEGIRHHHERHDGNGYPDGLRADQIPLIAKIICVADSFDAMTSQRSYRDAMSEEAALREVEKCKGTQFDPHIADIFLKLYQEKFTSGG